MHWAREEGRIRGLGANLCGGVLWTAIPGGVKTSQWQGRRARTEVACFELNLRAAKFNHRGYASLGDAMMVFVAAAGGYRPTPESSKLSEHARRPPKAW